MENRSNFLLSLVVPDGHEVEVQHDFSKLTANFVDYPVLSLLMNFWIRHTDRFTLPSGDITASLLVNFPIGASIRLELSISDVQIIKLSYSLN